MSNREMCIALLDDFTEPQLVNVAAMLQTMRQAILDAVTPNIPNTETIAALKEGDEILRNGSGAGWTGSTEELFQKILEEDG